ncbi:MAG: antitoxin [Gammaproteobacteria bacterium]
MKASTVFTNGPSTQAVRIPKEYRFDTQEVWIERVADGLLIRPKPASWDDFFHKTPRLTDDFSLDRHQQLPQKREDF